MYTSYSYRPLVGPFVPGHRLFLSGAAACSSSSTMSYWSAKDDGSEITQTIHIIPHGTIMLEVVYTNDPLKVNEILRKYEGWLDEEKHRFVGLDLEYTLNQKRCAVLQLSMRNHVLVYHYVRYEY